MPGLVPGIHVFISNRIAETWMAGTSPGMTQKRRDDESLIRDDGK